MQTLQTNVVFKHLQTSNARIIVEQGGTRSGKTYNILMWLIFDYCHNNNNKIVSIVRKSFPALRGTVMRDFFEILVNVGLYSEDYHNKSVNEYRLLGNTIEFLSVDDPQKVRGRKRDVLFVNEANELTLEDYRQLMMRTTSKIILDYNPSEEFHWIYDHVLIRDDCEFFKTTYLDNPFLEESLIGEIEKLKNIDENYWNVYGLGNRGQSRSLVFSFIEVDTIPPTAKFMSYGMDFGYSNDPTSLIAMYLDNENLYFDELIYQTGMTNSDLGNMLKSLNIDRRDVIWGDSAEPKTIAELHRFGFNVKGTAKGADSINVGIDMMRRYTICLTKRSLNMIKEMRNYKYIEDKDGKLTNKPIDAFNHAIDSCRYAIYNTLSRPNVGKYSIR
jgi:phage terminase large subunit